MGVTVDKGKVSTWWLSVGVCAYVQYVCTCVHVWKTYSAYYVQSTLDITNPNIPTKKFLINEVLYNHMYM